MIFLLCPVNKRKFRILYEKKQAVVTTLVYAIIDYQKQNDYNGIIDERVMSA